MLYLLYKNLITFIKHHSLVFSLFCISQIISILSVLFMYGLLFSSQNMDKQYKEKGRTITVTSVAAFTPAVQNAIHEVTREKKAELSRVTLKLEGANAAANVFYSPDQKKWVEYGSYFSKEEFERGEKQVVLFFRTGDHFTKQVGDSVNLLGSSYKIIGFHSDYGTEANWIPLTGIPKNQALEKMTFVLKQEPSSMELDEWRGYLEDNFPNCLVDMPERPSLQNRLQEKNQLFSAAGIGLIAVLNFSYLYRYLLEKRRHTYSVLRITGCSTRRGFSLFALETVFLSTVLFLLCSTVFHFGISKLYTSIRDLLYGMTFSDFLSLYAVYLLVVLLAFCPMLIKYSKKTPVELYQEVRS